MLIPEKSIIYYFDMNSISHVKKKKNSKCKKHKLISKNKIEYDVLFYEVDGLYVLGNKPMIYFMNNFSSYIFKPYIIGKKASVISDNTNKNGNYKKKIAKDKKVEKIETGFVFFIYDKYRHEYCNGTLLEKCCKIYNSNINDFIEITCFVCSKCKKNFIMDYSEDKYGGCTEYRFLEIPRQKEFLSKYLLDVSEDNLPYKLLNKPHMIYYDGGNQECRYCHDKLNISRVTLGSISQKKYITSDILVCDNCCKIYLSRRTDQIDDVVVNNYNIKYADFEDYFNKKRELRRIEEENRIKKYEFERQKEIEYLESLSKVNLTYSDFLIVGNTTKHDESHSLTDIMAVVNVVTKSKKIITLEVPAFYCKLCDKYYILSDYYDNIIEFGFPVVKTIQYDRFISGDYSFETLNERSKLNLLGYNVNSNDELSDLQRQNILLDIVDSSLMTRNEISSFLQFLINTHSSDRDQKARVKWSKDREFIMSYSISNLRRVNVRTIKLYNSVRSKYE